MLRLSMFLKAQYRGYRKHIWQHAELDMGRSVSCHNSNPNRAYAALRDIINEAKLREIVRAQKRFVSKPDKRRAKRKAKDWDAYLCGVKRQVLRALTVKNKADVEKKNYTHI